MAVPPLLINRKVPEHAFSFYELKKHRFINKNKCIAIERIFHFLEMKIWPLNIGNSSHLKDLKIEIMVDSFYLDTWWWNYLLLMVVFSLGIL